jgi:SAM-dependent methyltransferase
LLDRALGIDTVGVVELEDLQLDDHEREAYVASGWLDLLRILPPGEVKPGDVFVDLGSGKGRVIMLASRYRFDRVIGVELSDRLNAIARRNLGRRRCRRVEIVTADALDYETLDDATVVYMYNPFRGATFDTVIRKLIASVDRRPRTIRLIYLNPMEHDRLMATGRFRLLREAGRLRPRRDAAASSYIRMYELEPVS